MNKNSKIYIAGHRGLVGSAIMASLHAKGYNNIITRSHDELDLVNQADVSRFFVEEKPQYVFLAAAKVGGIAANNTYRASFIYNNLMIQSNVIHAAYENDAEKLLFLGSSCIYPKNADQPMKEECLLTSSLEYTNEPYAIAKIAGIKMCESYNIEYGTNFISVMPTNLYGYNDNFDLEKSHVLPAILRKIYLGKCLETENWQGIKKDLNRLPIEEITGESSKETILKKLSKFGINKDYVEIWGTGKPFREFLWSEDMADACVFIMENSDFKDTYKGKEIRNTQINIGSGVEITIKQLAEMIKKTASFQGELVFDNTKPDGTMRKLTDISKIKNLGWENKVDIESGIKKLYEWYVK